MTGHRYQQMSILHNVGNQFMKLDALNGTRSAIPSKIELESNY